MSMVILAYSGLSREAVLLEVEGTVAQGQLVSVIQNLSNPQQLPPSRTIRLVRKLSDQVYRGNFVVPYYQVVATDRCFLLG